MAKKPVMLMILDGWGINDHKDEKNAIADVHPKNISKLLETYPNSRIKAAGEAVGLPEGQMGNSEVGHLNLGAGRVIYQPLVKISKDIKDGDFFEIETLKEAFNHAKKNNSAVHLGGLLSDGGVHSHNEHLYGFLEMAKKVGVEKVYIHTFLDGRDTPPQSADGYIAELEEKIKEIGVGQIATVTGRYYAMDRDGNYDRTKLAYDAMANQIGNKAPNAITAVKDSDANDINDEFVMPTIIEGVDGKLEDGDVFININFRPDRARQITRAINDKDFTGFEREYKDIEVLCMRQYDSTIDAKIIYVDEKTVNTLGEVLAKNGLNQLRTAETEKYAHVTFFFNGGEEIAFENEDRKLVASPKVATYDLQPEMSAYEVTTGVLEALEEDKYDVIILNFANPDMVGHTGNFEAAKKAVEVVDECVGKISDKMLELDGVLMITADHGNVDLMEDPKTHVPFTAHTTNDVPFILVSNRYKDAKVVDGKLADFAPTILTVLGVEVPKEMTGNILIK
jgi:2,3-bisphosphoglycerate-independent phosphoglycerate mutase